MHEEHVIPANSRRAKSQYLLLTRGAGILQLDYGNGLRGLLKASYRVLIQVL